MNDHSFDRTASGQENKAEGDNLSAPSSGSLPNTPGPASLAATATSESEQILDLSLDKETLDYMAKHLLPDAAQPVTTQTDAERVAEQLCSISPELDAPHYENTCRVMNKAAALIRSQAATIAEQQSQYAMLYDEMHSTPCEQIRHQQEVELLREQLSEREREVAELQRIADRLAILGYDPVHVHAAGLRAQEFDELTAELAALRAKGEKE